MYILFINNNDSFVYNLVNYICQLQPASKIIIEDNRISIEKVKDFKIETIIISQVLVIQNTILIMLRKYYKEYHEDYNILSRASRKYRYNQQDLRKINKTKLIELLKIWYDIIKPAKPY